MTLDDVLAFCAELGFDAVDPTGYYFPGYPAPPDDAYLYRFKKRAFLLGLDISGTGVRNDFTRPDPAPRAEDVALVKQWVHVAAKMDAPVLRIFAGAGVPDGHTEETVYTWLAEHMRDCAAYGEQHGVMIVLQNHHDVLKTADQVITILERVDSEWLGLNLDIGSLRTTADPYEEIARLTPYAYTWQLKENVYRNGVEEKTDVAKVIEIIRTSSYRGYLPLETLGPGDPREKVPAFLEKVRQALT
jgi:sugar phosphate isomerase/epimerase